MNTETITWNAVGDRLPDADLTVLVAIRGCDEPIWLGYFDGDGWLSIDGTVIDVTNWSDMPSGPESAQ